MKSLLSSILFAALLLQTCGLAAAQSVGQSGGRDRQAQDPRVRGGIVKWPQFRGVQAGGVDDSNPLPSKWDCAKNKGVLWRTRIPGLSHSSPIVWGDRVFVATAVAKGSEVSLKIGLYGAGESADDMVEHSFQLWCLSLDGGRPLWMRTATRSVPRFARHTKASHVDSTPVTDGKYVVAVFGAQGMFCYTVDGDFRWKVELGALDVGPHNDKSLHWGYASSPVIANGKVIVQADVKTDPYLAAWDVATGKLLWRVKRDDTTTWATPTVIGGDSPDAQVIVNGCKHMGAYSLADGKEIWRMAGGGGLPVPAPVVAGDLLLLTSNHRPLVAGHPLKPVFAVKRSATGVLPLPAAGEPGKHVAWMKARVGNYIQTPLFYRGLVYLCSIQGIVKVLEVKTGEQFNKYRLASGVGFSASAVAGDGKVYFTSEEGDVFIVKAGDDYESLGRHSLGEICMATPAIARGALLFRTRGQVIAVGSR